MEAKMNAFILAIFSNVIFPVDLGKVEGSVIIFCDQMIKHNLNPVPAILAETMAALNFCRKKGKGRMRCCTQMLYVWAVAHLRGTGKKFIHRWFKGGDPLSEVTEIPLEEKNMWAWVRYFQELTKSNLLHQLQWVSPRAFLYGCGKQPWVPLMGYNNLITYAPALGMKQLGGIQFVPCTRGLSEVECRYNDPKAVEMIGKAKADWKVLTYANQDETGIEESEKYQEWHMARHKAIHIPVPPSDEIQREPSEVATQQSWKVEYSQEQKTWERIFDIEQECNQQKNEYLAEMQRAKFKEVQSRWRATKLETDLEKMTKRMNKMADKSEKLRMQNDDKGRRMKRIAAENTRKNKVFKVKEVQWQNLMREKQDSYEQKERECNFYKQQAEELVKLEEEYEAITVEQEIELREMIRKNEMSEEMAYQYQRENHEWRQSLYRIQQHRDDCLRVIDEQDMQYKVARGDCRQFCQTLLSELQPAIDGVKRAHRKVTKVLDNIGPGQRNLESVRQDLAEAQEDLAPYLHAKVAPRKIKDKDKGKEKIQELDEEES